MNRRSRPTFVPTSDKPFSVDSVIEEAGGIHAVKLNLSNKGLTELPESIYELTHLRHLDLSSNRLTDLPESIGKLTELRHLNLAHNQLIALPESISHFSHLTYLGLWSNKLLVVPQLISNLSKLKTLSIGANQLVEIPDFLQQLGDLDSLAFWDNALKALPEFIGNLNNLTSLYLQDNEIAVLPESLGQLTKLEILNVENNRLSALPNSFEKLKSLKRLFLHGNISLDIPREILGSKYLDVYTRSARPTKPSEILAYYFRARGDQRRPLNEAKLILVGRGAVGKTSVVNRLVHRTFKDEKKTEGIRITEWPLKIGRKKEDVRLNVWDFGGQEIMHATHQFFLTERSLYLLVLSGREGGEDAEAEYWLKLIQSFGGDSPVIVVLNKIKEHPFDVNRSALAQKYSFIREFIKTDCKPGKDGFGIARLRRVVERETDRLKHLRDAFPASWFSIKDKLAGMKKNFLSFEEYRKECVKLGEEDPEAQEALAFYLHSLGIALNYKDDARLKDTHVLNPHWVTKGIYKILNAKRLEQQKGVIRQSHLPGILDKRNYPAEMHRFLLDLMKKFELCFSLPGKEGDYLIPELLSKQEPKQAHEFDPQECLNFQYDYPVLPEGLLPRFIVRTHVLSDDTPRWRTGVILKLEDNLALVRADAQERRVLINIKGPVTTRRRLLSIIRANFDRIHGSIKNLKPAEIVPLPEQPNAHVRYDELLAWEGSGKEGFEKAVDGEIVTLNVQRLLNGVELEGERVSRVMYNVLNGSKEIEFTHAARVFVSYSHKDERQLNELKTHLSPLERLKLIETWYDRRIVAGEDFGQKINDNLESADIILLLISADFIASKYCYEVEMKRALERHANKEARVVPVIVRKVNWKVIPELSKLEAVPKDGKPVPDWPTKDSGWCDVSERVQVMLEAMRDAGAPGRRAR